MTGRDYGGAVGGKDEAVEEGESIRGMFILLFCLLECSFVFCYSAFGYGFDSCLFYFCDFRQEFLPAFLYLGSIMLCYDMFLFLFLLLPTRVMKGKEREEVCGLEYDTGVPILTDINNYFKRERKEWIEFVQVYHY